MNYIKLEESMLGYRFGVGCNYQLRNGGAFIFNVNYQHVAAATTSNVAYECRVGYMF